MFENLTPEEKAAYYYDEAERQKEITENFLKDFDMDYQYLMYLLK